MPASGITITNTFASQSGNVPASELDVNFSQGITALNSLGQYSNYFVDSGSANSMAITVPSPLVASLVAGLPLQVKVAAANTGATTLTINGGASTSVVYPSGSTLVSGQLSIGGIINVMYDGTNFQYFGSITGVTSVAAGSGISVSGAVGNVTIANTANSSGSFTASLTGISGSSTGIVNWAQSGLLVVLNIPTLVGTSNSDFMTVSGIPSGLQPAAGTYQSPLVVTADAGTPVYTSFGVLSPGTNDIVYWKDATGFGTWTNSGVKTVLTHVFSYLLI